MDAEHIWEEFDRLNKVLARQGRRVEELEARVASLEWRLAMRPLPPLTLSNAHLDAVAKHTIVPAESDPAWPYK